MMGRNVSTPALPRFVTVISAGCNFRDSESPLRILSTPARIAFEIALTSCEPGAFNVTTNKSSSISTATPTEVTFLLTYLLPSMW